MNGGRKEKEKSREGYHGRERMRNKRRRDKIGVLLGYCCKHAMMVRKRRSGFDTAEVHIEHFGAGRLCTLSGLVLFPSLSTVQFSLLQYAKLKE